MNCDDLLSALNVLPFCEPTEDGLRVRTHCLYPSADPVFTYVGKLNQGYLVSDGGGALRSALVHGRSCDGYFDKACKRHSVEVRGFNLVAQPSSADWLRAAIIAVANASAMVARLAVEADLPREESSLRADILDRLKLAVPESKIGSEYEYRGRSGHVWKVDFAIKEERLLLIKSVVQNGNSINSNYATFGDIGDDDESLRKFSVYRAPLAQDSEALLRQVTTLVPIASVHPFVEQQAYRRRLS